MTILRVKAYYLVYIMICDRKTNQSELKCFLFHESMTNIKQTATHFAMPVVKIVQTRPLQACAANRALASNRSHIFTQKAMQYLPMG